MQQVEVMERENVDVLVAERQPRRMFSLQNVFAMPVQVQTAGSIALTQASPGLVEIERQEKELERKKAEIEFFTESVIDGRNSTVISTD